MNDARVVLWHRLFYTLSIYPPHRYHTPEDSSNVLDLEVMARFTV